MVMYLPMTAWSLAVATCTDSGTIEVFTLADTSADTVVSHTWTVNVEQY